MTIDEAIEQFKYDAECNRADLDLSYAEDNEQVAEWLEELKAIKDGSIPIIHGKEELELRDKVIRNKAIDDFAETLIPRLTDAIYPKDVEGMRNLINDVAEQLKAGD